MDCGIGVPAESAQRIFDAFVTTKSSGMGMGLSICVRSFRLMADEYGLRQQPFGGGAFHAALASSGSAMTDHPKLPAEPEGSREPVVLVVDDDESMREALQSLFRSVGLRVNVFGSAAEFMRSSLPNAPSCLVLDVRLPGVSGLDFQADLTAAGIHIPIIFMTGHGDIPMSVQAMKAGAVDFLTKPFRHQEMIHAVNRELVADRKRRADHATVSEWRRLYESLTVRERQVVAS